MTLQKEKKKKQKFCFLIPEPLTYYSFLVNLKKKVLHPLWGLVTVYSLTANLLKLADCEKINEFFEDYWFILP